MTSRWNSNRERWELDGPMDFGAFWLLVLALGGCVLVLLVLAVAAVIG